MRTIKTTAWALVLIALTTFIFTACNNEEELAPAQEVTVENTLDKKSDNARKSQVIEFSLKGVEDGRHEIARNPSTGSVAYIVLERGRLSSLIISKRSGTYIFDDFSKGNPNPGCPDGFQKCFVHKICGVICLRVCIATNLTLSLDQDW